MEEKTQEEIMRNREYQRRYREKDRERYNWRQREYYHKNKEKVKEQRRLCKERKMNE